MCFLRMIIGMIVECGSMGPLGVLNRRRGKENLTFRNTTVHIHANVFAYAVHIRT